MASLLEADEAVNGIVNRPAPDALADSIYGSGANPAATNAQAQNASNWHSAIKGALPDLVKGAGLARKGGNAPLTNEADIAFRASEAAIQLRARTQQGFQAKADVVKGMNQGFLNDRGALRTALTAPSMGEQIMQIVGAIPGAADAIAKSFTAGNLGIGSVYGLTPFDLLAPSRLIYPVYTVN